MVGTPLLIWFGHRVFSGRMRWMLLTYEWYDYLLFLYGSNTLASTQGEDAVPLSYRCIFLLIWWIDLVVVSRRIRYSLTSVERCFPLTTTPSHSALAVFLIIFPLSWACSKWSFFSVLLFALQILQAIKGKVVVGHSLDNDLRMLDICLPRRQVVDISRICAVRDRMLKETGKEKLVYSLKLMSQILLNRSIQVMQMIFVI